MGSISTAFCNTAKSELFSGAHKFLAIITKTVTSLSGNTLVTGLSNTSGIAVGMAATGNVIPANTTVANLHNSTQITLSNAPTGSTNFTATFTGDNFYIALIQGTPTGIYDASTTNYTDITGNSDEVSGAGYTAGGQLLTNVSPVLSSSTSYLNFSPNPTFTNATFTSLGCMIYNSTANLGGTSGTNTTGGGRAIGVFNYGLQSVSSGTYTILMPSATTSTAIIRMS